MGDRLKTRIKVLVILLITICLGGIYTYRVHQINQEELRVQESIKKWQQVKKNPFVKYHMYFTSAEKRKDPSAVRADLHMNIYSNNPKSTVSLELDHGFLKIKNLHKLGCFKKMKQEEVEPDALKDYFFVCEVIVVRNDDFTKAVKINEDTFFLWADWMDESEFSTSDSNINSFLDLSVFYSEKTKLLIKRTDLKNSPVYFVDFNVKDLVDPLTYLYREQNYMRENNISPKQYGCLVGDEVC